MINWFKKTPDKEKANRVRKAVEELNSAIEDCDSLRVLIRTKRNDTLWGGDFGEFPIRVEQIYRRQETHY